MRVPEPLDVPVPGGQLRLLRWPGSGPAPGPVVLAAHGITASAASFATVAERVGGAVSLVAVDLRGRGGSAELAGPYGLDAHTADLVAVLDHLGVRRATALGHSMGAFVVARLAARHPDRVERLVLVDGGVPLDVPPGTDPDQVLEAVVGPALERLRMTFENRAAYRDFWRRHPAFAGIDSWNSEFERYLDYDLTGEEPLLRARVSEQAVREDGRDVLDAQAHWLALAAIRCPVRTLRAPRGMLDQPQPLFPDEAVTAARELVPQLEDELVAGTNHYSILLGDPGASAVAACLRPLVPER
jgi:pimeloyl-ACP methyl ester carboxylesterase